MFSKNRVLKELSNILLQGLVISIAVGVGILLADVLLHASLNTIDYQQSDLILNTLAGLLFAIVISIIFTLITKWKQSRREQALLFLHSCQALFVIVILDRLFSLNTLLGFVGFVVIYTIFYLLFACSRLLQTT
jgi:ABC-type multidrug transport system permease subunit